MHLMNRLAKDIRTSMKEVKYTGKVEFDPITLITALIAIFFKMMEECNLSDTDMLKAANKTTFRQKRIMRRVAKEHVDDSKYANTLCDNIQDRAKKLAYEHIRMLRQEAKVINEAVDKEESESD